ncbi:MAG: hypothetical protein JEY97_02555 [Bacteroidales bacterium]|nr:hypothetical protein [Bacteroidales bacterium]
MAKFYIIKFILFCLFFCMLSAIGQDNNNIPELTESDLKNGEIIRNETFNGNSLWGYMNGGADIYLEYGFKGLRVQEFKLDDQIIKAEIYLMGDQESAFGIYSIKKFHCLFSDTLICPDCQNNYQYQSAKGPIYISITNEKGSDKANAACLETGKKILEKVKASEFKLPVFQNCNKNYLSLNDSKLIKGRLGLQNGISKWIGLFEDFDDYTIYYLPFKSNNCKIYFAEIIFREKSDQDQFLLKNFDIKDIENNIILIEKPTKKFGVKKINSKTIRLFESTSPESCKEVLEMFGF